MVLPLIPIAGWTAATLGGTALGAAAATPVLSRTNPDLMDGIKDEFGWSIEDAAKEEYSQRDSGRGYNVETGEIKRTFAEQARDWFVGNTDTAKMTEEAQKLHQKTLKLNNPGVADLNTRLTALNLPTIDISATTSQEDLNKQLDRINRTLPQLEGIKGVGGDISGLSTYTDSGTLASELDTARTDRSENKYRNSQEYIDLNSQRNLTNQLAIGELAASNRRADNQMAIAQMNNQLQMRREDRASARDDRKDRQAMIMMLMKGLGQMGQGFAI